MSLSKGLGAPAGSMLAGSRELIARALRISAETLYVRAGFLEPRTTDDDVERSILRDGTLTGRQKEALIEVYRSFQSEPQEDG